MPKFIFCLMGPTASYKTQLACELSDLFPFEIISVDSAMIYREMDIGTAKPTVLERQQYPHHLVDILDPSETYSASEFCADANKLIDEIFSRGKIPLLVGGTMMYFKVLQQGLSMLPEADSVIRTKLLEEAHTLGWASLHKKLEQVDPNSASRIHPNDTQRIQRALEVFYLTGQPLSDFCAKGREKKEHEFINLILYPESRHNLHERIALRFKQMLSNGLVEEVIHVLQKWNLNPNCTSMRSVGYRQTIDCIQKKESKETLYEKGVAATRQLAKRQLTWLRKWESPLFFCPEELKKTKESLKKVITNQLSNLS